MRDIKNLLTPLSKSFLWYKPTVIHCLLWLTFILTGTNLIVRAAPSDLDPAFGTGGKLMWTVGFQSLQGADMALQPDGKIVHVGGFNDTTPRFLVARYNPDGSLDPTFNGIGWINISFGGTYEYATAVEIQPDGKIVVGGSANQPTGGQDAAIARFNPDGTLDNSFSGDGRVTVNFPDFQSLGGYPEYLNTLKLASDGKIVFAGGALGTSLNFKKFIGRLNPDGSLDSTFDADGRLTELMGTGAWVKLLIQPDGSLILTGSASSGSASSIAAKYSSTGTREWDFSRDTAPGCSLLFRDIARQADGKLVIAGAADCRILATRINPDGTLDNSFSTTTVTPVGRATSVAIQPDGKIVAGASFESPSNGFSLIRYNADGTLDTGFGNGGLAVNGIASPDSGNKVVIQPDGKILLGGYARPAVNSYQFGMVRYLGGSSAPRKTPFDYDGDGKSDISVFRPAENRWYILRSSNLSVVEVPFGAAGDIPTPADFDGDGKTDPAVFRPSAGDWWYLSSQNGNQVNVHFGQSGDVPRPSDFDGDGKTDFVVYRPSNSVWYRLGTTGQTTVTQFGIAEDKPLVGDFDGDGKSDLAVFRPSTGDWWYAASASGGQFSVVHWGQLGDIPVPGDYDADGRTDFVVYRPSNGGWYILRSGEQNYTILSFGLAEDKPVAGDYDGDGKADVAVWRPSTGVWYLLQTTSGFGAVQFGLSGDVPTENAFLP